MKIEIPLSWILWWVFIGLITDLCVEWSSKRSRDPWMRKDWHDLRIWLLVTCLTFWPYCWTMVICKQIKHWRKPKC